VSTYLALAGVGQISLIDHGTVELSNLNRQSLYGYEDIGRSKVDSAKEKLAAINPNLQIQGLREEIKEENVWSVLEGYNIIVDALDNLGGRYLLNEAVLSKNLPLFHGAVYGYEGRVTTIIPGKTPCLKCIYHGHGTLPPTEIPVIGVVPAIIGCLQSGEVIKYILGIGQLLARRLLIYDGLSQEFFEVQTKFDPNCNVCVSVNLSAKE
jgi:molybdopterin/thiamine biosynthesis adenylyltransferase